MSTLKPIGSEKLQGHDKLKRILEIARFNEVTPTPINETSRSEYSITLADGNNYQVVKERLGYVIKKTISESDTEYIEPMKNRKYYSSYSQAFKRLNLLAGELNRLNENEEGVSLFGEQKKFVLKTPKPETSITQEAPAVPPPVPSPELPPSPLSGGVESLDTGTTEELPSPEIDSDSDMGDVETDVEIDEPTDVGGVGVTFKSIQKLTGKLSQKIRTLENEKGLTSEDIKYVINMILSSFNLETLSDEDKEDIISKFDTEEGGMEDSSYEDISSDTEVDNIQTDMDVPVEQDYGMGAIVDSIFGESKIDSVISKYFEISKKEILENRKKFIVNQVNDFSKKEKEKKELFKLAESYEQELSTKKFLEENPTAKIIGKTNLKNLVLEKNNKKYKITPNGYII